MDWPRARAILLAAFTAVNLILAYSIWGPNRFFPDVYEFSDQRQFDQVRSRLADQGLYLPLSVQVPRVPEPMRFLHVEYRSTPDFPDWLAEFSGDRVVRPPHPGRDLFNFLDLLNPGIDEDSQAIVYRPGAQGVAARDVRLDSRVQVLQAAEDFLRLTALLPPQSVASGIYPQEESGQVEVEFVPSFDGYAVFSGYVRVAVSARGIETVKQFWVYPRGYTDAPPKAIRPVDEALLRLAGRLDRSPDNRRRTITEIRLGYYAGHSFTISEADAVNGWDTVPFWRFTLDNGEVYYINAFNGEWES